MLLYWRGYDATFWAPAGSMSSCAISAPCDVVSMLIEDLNISGVVKTDVYAVASSVAVLVDFALVNHRHGLYLVLDIVAGVVQKSWLLSHEISVNQ